MIDFIAGVILNAVGDGILPYSEAMKTLTARADVNCYCKMTACIAK